MLQPSIEIEIRIIAGKNSTLRTVRMDDAGKSFVISVDGEHWSERSSCVGALAALKVAAQNHLSSDMNKIPDMLNNWNEADSPKKS